jgi:phage gp46-like protein
MDVELNLTANGGDAIQKGSDLAMVFSLENMPLLALFGGNVEADTPTRRAANQHDRSFWANNLLWPNNPSLQFNSLTERALLTTPLTSAGRLLIESAIKKDLEHMQPFATITVATAIIATDVIQILIRLVMPDNLQEKEFIFIWDKLRESIITEGGTLSSASSLLAGFEYELQMLL